MDTKERLFQKLQSKGYALDREAFNAVWDVAQNYDSKLISEALLERVVTQHTGLRRSFPR